MAQLSPIREEEKLNALAIGRAATPSVDALRGKLRPDQSALTQRSHTPHLKRRQMKTTFSEEGVPMREQTPYEAITDTVASKRNALEALLGPPRRSTTVGFASSQNILNVSTSPAGLQQRATSPASHRKKVRKSALPPSAMHPPFGQDPFQEFEKATGFERMEASMQRVHNRMLSVPLEERWRIMSHWMDRYFIDRDVEVLVNVVEKVQKHITERLEISGHLSGSYDVITSDQDDATQPSGVRIACSMMLLEQMLHVLARVYPHLYDSAIIVRDEILNAIYTKLPAEDINNTFELIRDPDDMAAQRRLISRFHSKTYFHRLRDEMKAKNRDLNEYETAQQVKGNQMRVMDRTVQHWLNYTKARVFNAWKGAIAQIKRERKEGKSKQDLLDEIESLKNTIDVKQTELTVQKRQHEEAMFKVKKEMKALQTQLAEEKEERQKAESKHAYLRNLIGENGDISRIEAGMRAQIATLERHLEIAMTDNELHKAKITRLEDEGAEREMHLKELIDASHVALDCVPKVDAHIDLRVICPGGDDDPTDGRDEVSVHFSLLKWAQAEAAALVSKEDLFKDCHWDVVTSVRHHVYLYAVLLDVPLLGKDESDYSISHIATDVLRVFGKIGLKGLFRSAVDLATPFDTKSAFGDSEEIAIAERPKPTSNPGSRRGSFAGASLRKDVKTVDELKAHPVQAKKHTVALFHLHQYRYTILPKPSASSTRPSKTATGKAVGLNLEATRTVQKMLHESDDQRRRLEMNLLRELLITAEDLEPTK